MMYIEYIQLIFVLEKMLASPKYIIIFPFLLCYWSDSLLSMPIQFI